MFIREAPESNPRKANAPDALSSGLEATPVDLKRERIQADALALVPETIARKYNLIPLRISGGTLVLVMADPENLNAIEDVAVRSKLRIEPVMGNPADIRSAIDLSYRASNEIERQVGQLVPSAEALEKGQAGGLEKLIAQTPIVRAVDLLIQEAVKDRASDIHIEPQVGRLRLRFRIDGILHNMMSLPMGAHAQLLSRVKILAGMNIAERRHPQDGQISMKVDNREVDIRVATCDTAYGEMAVLRILDKSRSLFTLPELGLLAGWLQTLQKMLKSPYGMVLVAGPTGSGKTTTLYAAVNQLNREEQKIITVEDPIEYRFPDINQIQVNAKGGVTFATGLRSILRLDPDAILVGEIRDTETAEIAIQAALTGHLLLSSIHANDAIGVLFRLLDLGVPSYLISSALIGVVAQRMVRRVCPHCRNLSPATPEEKVAFEQEVGEPRESFYYGTGCNFCANTGYLGRIGIFEILTLSEDMRRLLTANRTSSELRQQAINDGMVFMRRDAMLKVEQGITNPREVLRNVFSIT